MHAIDLLRLIASAQMIAGHTIEALLAPEHRVGAVFEVWTFLRGLTAPAFLFAAGSAFVLATDRSSPGRSRRRVLRALGLVALSYALHPPVAALGDDAALAAAAWREFFAVDVLASIGVTLLVLELLARVRTGFVGSTAVLAALAIGAAPVASRIVPGGLALPVADYFSRAAGSLFPLTPFAGFVFAGAALGSLALREPRPQRRLAVMAGATLLAAGALWASTTPPPPDAYYAWPALSLLRLGLVLALAAALAFASERAVELPGPVGVLASQSLFLYVTHLLVLYVGGVGLARVIGPTLGPYEAGLAAVLMIVGAGGSALLVARTKRR